MAAQNLQTLMAAQNLQTLMAAQNLNTCAPIWKKALSITGLNTAQAKTGSL